MLYYEYCQEYVVEIQDRPSKETQFQILQVLGDQH